MFSVIYYQLFRTRLFRIPRYFELMFCFRNARGGVGTLGTSGWGCAAGTLEPLTYTRASSAEFGYPILE